MRRAALALLVASVALGACSDAAPHSHAQRIGSLEEAVGGPHAIGRIGDFLLETDQIRLVISDTGVSKEVGKTTMGRVNTTFGGSLVDADLRRPGGEGGNLSFFFNVLADIFLEGQFVSVGAVGQSIRRDRPSMNPAQFSLAL